MEKWCGRGDRMENGSEEVLTYYHQYRIGVLVHIMALLHISGSWWWRHYWYKGVWEGMHFGVDLR